jgi:hypothetical protein
MAMGGNTNLIALTGILQQKTTLVAYIKQASKTHSLPKAPAADSHSLGTAEKQSQDTTTLSRAAIAAFENAQVISDETVIRADDSKFDALDMLQEIILERTEDALRAQANQTAEQVLALYES